MDFLCIDFVRQLRGDKNMSEVVILSGSPSESSRSDMVLRYIGETLRKESFIVRHISVRDVPQEALFYGQFDHPEILELASVIQNSKGVIVGSPVYKAAYSGVLKAFLDIMPQDVLQGKPVLPLMTGGSFSHLLAIEYTLKPLLATLKGQNLKGVFILDGQIDKSSAKNPIIDHEVRYRLQKQLNYFIETLNKRTNLIL
jgi:FMN reductase